MDRPDDVSFLDPRSWAVSVARDFARVGLNDSQASMGCNIFHECWVDQKLSLYVRYGHGTRLVATRLDRLDLDLLSDEPLVRGASAMTSSAQAVELYHLSLNGGPPVNTRWTDELGYSWFGETPAEGWENAVHGERLETVLTRR